jgi:hypothetical protein
MRSILPYHYETNMVSASLHWQGRIHIISAVDPRYGNRAYRAVTVLA